MFLDLYKLNKYRIDITRLCFKTYKIMYVAFYKPAFIIYCHSALALTLNCNMLFDNYLTFMFLYIYISKYFPLLSVEFFINQ